MTGRGGGDADRFGLASRPAWCCHVCQPTSGVAAPPRDAGILDAGPHPRSPGVSPMSNRTYRVTEIVGTSPDGIDQAVRNGVERAARTLRHVDWFEVTQVRGPVLDGAVEHFQVGHQGRLPPRGRLTGRWPERPSALVELRVLEGPNLYFPRAAIKLTLDVTALAQAPEDRPTPARRAPRHHLDPCRCAAERLPPALADPPGHPARTTHRRRVGHHPARRTRPSDVAARAHRGRLPLARPQPCPCARRGGRLGHRRPRHHRRGHPRARTAAQHVAVDRARPRPDDDPAPRSPSSR